MKTALIEFIEKITRENYNNNDIMFNGVITSKEIEEAIEDEELQLRLCHQDGFKNGVMYARNTGEISTFDEYYKNEFK